MPWATQVRARFLRGGPAFGVMAALAAAQNGTPLDQPVAQEIDESGLKTILYPEGFHPLPMLGERVAAFKGYLFAHYGGGIGILVAINPREYGIAE